MAGFIDIVIWTFLLYIALAAATPVRQKRSSSIPALTANANNSLVEINCLYSVHNTRKCTVPVKCQDSKKNDCAEILEGTFTKYDGITKYFQECIFTQWFANCTHYTNGTYSCRKAWQEPSEPTREWGSYAGDVYTGFYAIDDKTGLRKITPPGERNRPSSPQAPSAAQDTKRQRRELFGTC